MIKSLLVLASAAMLSMPLMATYQYGNYVQLNGGNLSVISGGNLTLNFSSPITEWQSLTIEATDASGNITTRNVAINGSSVDIGSFAQGDNLNFYLNGAQGATDKLQLWGSGWDNASNSYDYLHFGGNYGQWGSQYTNQQLQINGGASPSGQPLPGVLAALALGGSMLFLRRKFAKKSLKGFNVQQTRKLRLQLVALENLKFI